jgi:hypothetical protein
MGLTMTTLRSVIVVVLSLTFAASARAAYNVGDKPQLRIRTLDGTTFDLKDYKGKLVLVDFFFGKSDLDRVYHTHLLEAYTKQHANGLEMVSICCARTVDDVRQAVADFHITWPVGHNPEGFRGGLSAEWGCTRLPFSFLIGPDGTVLWADMKSTVASIVDAQMLQHPPQLVDPDVLKKANTDLDDVEKLLADKDREGAVKKFTRIADEAGKDKDFARRAAATREKVNAAADSMLAEVDDMIAAKQFAPAASRLRELLSVMSGLPTASLARTKLAELMSKPEVQRELRNADERDRADAAIAAARKLRDANEVEEAYLKFKAVAADYPDTPAGKTAADAVKAYEADPNFLKRMKDHIAAPRARAALNLAENYKSAGKIDQARKKYEEVVHDFPDTSFAETAKRELDTLK